MFVQLYALKKIYNDSIFNQFCTNNVKFSQERKKTSHWWFLVSKSNAFCWEICAWIGRIHGNWSDCNFVKSWRDGIMVRSIWFGSQRVKMHLSWIKHTLKVYPKETLLFVDRRKMLFIYFTRSVFSDLNVGSFDPFSGMVCSWND